MQKLGLLEKMTKEMNQPHTQITQIQGQNQLLFT